MKKILLSLALLFASVQAHAQSATVLGTVKSTTDATVLPGATVLLENAAGTSTATVTDAEGVFRFERVSPGQYTLRVNYLGFKSFSRAIKPEGRRMDVGEVMLQEETTTIKEVQVVGRAPLGEMKGDTVQFNAKALKTNPDASAEDMIQKVPGVTIQNGTVQAQGEDVKQVLVDGKRFFGQDASTALRNLPAEIIESIQVFDKKSDQAEMSGVDDGNREKTINIVTRKDRRQGQMGKASAGYGTDDRYMVGASVNFFNNDQRITVTGLSNNINLFDFSVGETPGGGMRGRRGWGGGSPNGIISTNTLSLNYSDVWKEKMEVSGNYTFNGREIVNNQFRFQDYISPQDSGRVYTEDRLNTNKENNHRFNARFEYQINERNKLLITPSLTVQGSGNLSEVMGQIFNDNGPVTTTTNTTDRDGNEFDLQNRIFFSHRLEKAGRMFSARLNTSYGTDQENRYLNAREVYFREDKDSTTNQYTNLDRKGFSWSGNLSYTEPLSENARLQFEYNMGNKRNDADRRTYNREEQTMEYTRLDTRFSNVFESKYLTQSGGLGYNYNKEAIRLQLYASYQYATLESKQEYPKSYDINRSFTSVLPSAELEYKIDKTTNLSLNYNSSTNAPSVGQLQNVVNNTNPLKLSTGNASLGQDYQNRLSVRYRNFNPENNHMFFAGLFSTFTQDYIGSSTMINRTGAPIAIENGLELREGAQLTRPVNLDGYWNVRSFFNYGQPVNFISSNINAGGSIGYSRVPGLINDEMNYANNTDFGVRLTLSSNISENVDFTVSTNSSYNIIKNTLQTTRNNNYFSQRTNLRYNWIFWKGMVYRTELSHQLNSGLNQGLDNNYLLWNMSLSKKVFNNQKGEVSLSVNDLLKQNVSVQRNVSDFYVEDVQSSVLQRYFMLTFTYNIRNYTGPAPAEENGRRRGDGPRRD
ncbi:TonB-dependent receptor [Pontibacter sp. E15-1]|uniref:TonB-dependent receptor n=1 Tax=Pontibacter sp. E15-1 TaxID=2919918 RepID=UPI001F50071D|nr:TonB-dependent receptor [Pontibacter sp. E15-1]MCJ8166260.1 TonB-dependent receptor [Pontibacter sp. E15-1]